MRYVDWTEYGELLRRLNEDLRSYTFDGVVAVGRGGSMVAAYLSSKLGIPVFVPVFVRHVRSGDGV